MIQVKYTNSEEAIYIDDIKTIINNDPQRHLKTLNSKRCKYLVDFINDKTPKLASASYTLSTKIYWLLNNLTDFPICPICKQPMTNKNVAISKGYPICCSRRCSGKNPQRIKRVIESVKTKYGVDNISQLATVKHKKCTTMLVHYGVKHPLQSTDIQNKVKQTCLTKYGVENPQQNTKIRQKTIDTNIRKYGAPMPLQNVTIQEKSKQTCLDKYGVENYSQTTQHIDKCKATCQFNRQTDFPSQSAAVRKKIKQTCLDKYGVEHYSQTDEFAKQRRKRIAYDNLTFDSSWEVEVYKYCKEHNLQCIYQPNVKFKYVFSNKTRYYHPDFLIKGKLYEVKGDHFFKEDGTMQNPFNHAQDAAYEAKHQCMIINNVVILTGADLQNISITLN